MNRLRGSFLVRLRDGSYALARGSRALWHSERGATFGDDGDGIDLSSLGGGSTPDLSSLGGGSTPDLSGLSSDAASSLGNLAGSLGSTVPDASSLSSLASSLPTNVTGLANQASSLASLATSSPAGAASAFSSIASQVPGSAGQTLGQAASVATQGASALSSIDTSSPEAALASGTNLLATAPGAAGAAGQILSAAQGGDWKGAGLQALQLAQKVASSQSSTGAAAMANAGKMAAAGASAGAAIGSIVPGIGTAIGGAVGAVGGFIGGYVQTVTGAGTDPGPILAFANDYNGAVGGSNWFTTADPGFASAMQAAAPGAQIGPTNTGRDCFWRAAAYRLTTKNCVGMWLFATPQTLGLVGVMMKLPLPTGDRLPLVDWALWLAIQPDAMAQLTVLQKSDPGAAAMLMQILPWAIAEVLFFGFVPVLSSPKDYSPSGITAVRAAANQQAQKSGSEIAQYLGLRITPDDVETLLQAWWLLEPLDQHNRPPTSCLTGGQQITAGQTLYSPRGTHALTLQSDGNLVLYPNQSTKGMAAFIAAETQLAHTAGNALWASNTVGKGAVKAVMQADGNFVLYDGSNHAVWATGTNGKANGILTMQEDGNLVIYASFTSSTVYWAARSGPSHGPHIVLPGSHPENLLKQNFEFVSDFTTLGYMTPRSGMWAQGSDIQKNLARQIAQLLTKNGSSSPSDALAKLNAIGGADFLDLIQKDLQTISGSVPLAWPGDPLAIKKDPAKVAAHNAAAHKATLAMAHAKAGASSAKASANQKATAGPAQAKQATSRKTAKIAVAGGAALAAAALFLSLGKHATLGKRF